jgi:AraC-like DNA-binding protein
MKITEIKSCYIGPEISPEQFIAEHFFLYLAKGTVIGYDGSKNYTLNSGDYCLIRKNYLARYNKQKENDEFEKVMIIFDEKFLKKIKNKFQISSSNTRPTEPFIALEKNELIPNFIQSLSPYYNQTGLIDETFSDIKREELIIILLKIKPELADIFFDFNIPEKINLEEFMLKNFRFNVTVERFAYLTGRSLSAFKRDFGKIFNNTPSHWLVKKRLEEAYFLIEKKDKKPSDIYLDLGFEDLSHFSFAFKKLFGYAPKKLIENK